MNIKLISLLLLLVALTGCNSLSKEECLSADWKTIGYEDGSLGKSEMTIQSHRKSCAKINVAPDLAQYQQGYREGVRVYCKKTTGYQLGLNGGTYLGQCPADLEPVFLTAFHAGYELYDLTREMDKLKSSISSYESAIAKLETEKAEQKTLSETAASKERRQHLREINRLNDEIYHYEHDIAMTEQNLDALEHQYRTQQAKHHQMGY